MDGLTAVVGAGAVGCYFGGMLARAGLPVVLIGRAGHVDAINRDGLAIDGVNLRETIQVRASTEISSANGAHLVLFCVKATDTERVGRDLAAYVGPDIPVLSLQNGVDNAERLRAAAALNAYPVGVYVAARMTGPGQLRHSGRGDLVIGESSQSRQIVALFERAGVPCRVTDNVEGELWAKLVMNCAYNAISALCRSRYGPLAADVGARWVLTAAAQETVDVARAAGVRLPATDLVEAALALSASMPEAESSTAQDLARGKRTEIDALNGYVAGRGAELGVETPVNRTLHALVKRLEEATIPAR